MHAYLLTDMTLPCTSQGGRQDTGTLQYCCWCHHPHGSSIAGRIALSAQNEMKTSGPFHGRDSKEKNQEEIDDIEDIPTNTQTNDMYIVERRIEFITLTRLSHFQNASDSPLVSVLEYPHPQSLPMPQYHCWSH